MIFLLVVIVNLFSFLLALLDSERATLCYLWIHCPNAAVVRTVSSFHELKPEQAILFRTNEVEGATSPHTLLALRIVRLLTNLFRLQFLLPSIQRLSHDASLIQVFIRVTSL